MTRDHEAKRTPRGQEPRPLPVHLRPVRQRRCAWCGESFWQKPVARGIPSSYCRPQHWADARVQRWNDRRAQEALRQRQAAQAAQEAAAAAIPTLDLGL